MADEKSALEVERDKMEADAKAENATRSGKGLRTLVGATRGKATKNIKYSAFDESDSASLPTTVEEFISITGLKSSSDLCELLVVGFNDKAYTEASDPIAEHINPAWDKDTKTKFRAVVRGLVTINGETVESAVAMVKPGTEKKHQASLAASKSA